MSLLFQPFSKDGFGWPRLIRSAVGPHGGFPTPCDARYDADTADTDLEVRRPRFGEQFETPTTAPFGSIGSPVVLVSSAARADVRPGDAVLATQLTRSSWTFGETGWRFSL
jgi:hypothetical protein